MNEEATKHACVHVIRKYSADSFVIYPFEYSVPPVGSKMSSTVDKVRAVMKLLYETPSISRVNGR